MHHHFYRAAAWLSLCLLTSCTVVDSTYQNPLPGHGTTRGISYFLPVGKLHFVIVSGGSTAGVVVNPPPGAVAGTSNATAPAYSLQPVLVSYVADPKMQFTLNYHPSVLSEDTVDLTVSKSGLLTTVNMTTHDHTGDIIIKLVEVAQNVAKAMAIGEQSATTTVVYDVTFDPFDDAIASKVREDLLRFGFTFSLHLHGNPDTDKTPAAVRMPNLDAPVNGVAFRPVFAYDLIVEQNKRRRLIQTVLLPNQANVLTLPLTRTAFVTKVVNLTFDEGILTTVHINKPSEALAFMDIPLAIVKAIVALPTDLVQFKIDSSAKQQGLLDQEKKTAQSQQDLATLLQQIKDAKAKQGLTN